MENQLSVIAESVVEMSSSYFTEKKGNNSIKFKHSDEKLGSNFNKMISEEAEDNYKFLSRFHDEYENFRKDEKKFKNEIENDEEEKRLNKNLKRASTLITNKNTLSSKLQIKSNSIKLRRMSNENNEPFKEENKIAKNDSPERKNYRDLEKNLRRFSQKVIMDKLYFGSENLIKERKCLSPKNLKRVFTNDSPLIKYEKDKNPDSFKKLESNQKVKYSNSMDTEFKKKIDRSNTFCYKPDKKNFDFQKTKTNKKNVLTIDQIVQDINKNVITFSRRRSTIKDISQINSKNESSKFENRLSSQRIYPIKDTLRNLARENTIRFKGNFIKMRIERNFKRLNILIHVVTFVLFVKKEIVRYGIVPTKFKPMLEYDHQVLNKCESLNISNMEIFRKFKSMEEQLNKTKFPWYIIIPESTFQKIWEKVFLSILIYFVIFVPYRVSFTETYFNSQNIAYFYLDVFIELLFLLDIIFNCLKSFYNNEGNLVISVKNKIYIYFTSLRLIFDFLCLFPFLYSTSFFLCNYNVDKTIILFQYFRSIKLYLIVNSTTFVQNMEDKLSIHNGFVKLFVFLINTIFACHIFSCLFYYCCIIKKFDEQTWVYRNGWLDEDKPSLYLKSLYFAFTSYITVGYGDIVAYTTVEIVFVLVWLLFSGVFYTSSLTSLSKIFLDYSSNKFLINNKCMIVSEIFKKSKIPKKVERESIKFLKISYSKNKEKISVKDIKSLLSEIPMNLRYQIATEIYDGSLSRIPVLSKASKSFISNIVPLFQCMNVVPNNYVYQCDEVPHKIYFICEGSIKLQTEDLISFTTLNEGNYFGEIEILRKTYRELNAKAIDRCLLLTLNKNIVWDDIMKNHVEFLQYLIENMIKRHNFYERMRDIIEVLIEEGKKLMKQDDLEYAKKTFPKFSNYKKNLFFMSLVHNIENGMNESQLSKLNELLNKSLIEEDEQMDIENTSNLDLMEVDELYKRKERRRFTKMINKEEKRNSKKMAKKLMYKDNILRSSSKSLRSRINWSIHRKERNSTVIKMLQEISEGNEKIFEILNILNKKIEIGQENMRNIFSDLDENFDSYSNNGRVPKKVIEKLKELNTENMSN